MSHETPLGHAPALETHAAAVVLNDLTVTYHGSENPAVAGVNLRVQPGTTTALVGESGSGKSTTAAAIAGLLTHAHVQTTGLQIFDTDYTRASTKTWRAAHGTTVGYIPQDTGSGLNPVRTVRSQLSQVAKRHGLRGQAGTRRVAQVLSDVGLNLTEHGQRYPHELSGGQRQRVLIALALVGHPRLLIADEPTSALDVTVQKQVLDVLEDRVRASGASLILITHDLGVAADRADRIVVMLGGRVVEEGPAADIVTSPQTSYARALLAAAPGLDDVFTRPAADPSAPVLARLEQVSKTFGTDRGQKPAVDQVNLAVRQGTTLGIVGESGSGKSTTARLLLGLEQADSGLVEVMGTDMSLKGAALKVAKQAKFVHQDPSAALDPRMSVGDSIAEPLRGFTKMNRLQRTERVAEVLELVALPATMATRRPRELSGGQRQRVAIARALALNPELLVLDEPVSALDVSVQARILELLNKLQRELGLTYVFISHDLAVVRNIADEVAVMGNGQIVEHGPAKQVLGEPRAKLTKKLLAAVPGRSGVHVMG